MQEDQIIGLPKSSAHMDMEQLAYVSSFDAVVDKEYAYLVYKETNLDTGKWVVRIKGSVTAGTVFDPANVSLKNALKKAAAHDEAYAVWGFNLKPTDRDPRLVENRIFFDERGNPTALEVHLITRKADRSPMQEQSVRVPWPS